MDTRTRGALEMTAAMLISGTVGGFVVATGLPAATAVFWRCFFGALAMLGICAWQGLLRRGIIGRGEFALALAGGIALALNWVLLFSAYAHASIAVATTVYHTQPFMLVALGALLFRERVGLDTMGWLAIAFTGLGTIAFAREGTGAAGGVYLLGVAASLGAAFCYAVAALIAKRLKSVPPHLIVLIQMIEGAALLSMQAAPASTPQGWGLLALIGTVHTGLMSTLLYAALQKIPTALAGALSFIYPVVAILVDWIAFGHRLGLAQLAGVAAILLAAAGMNFGWSLRLRGCATPGRPSATPCSSRSSGWRRKTVPISACNAGTDCSHGAQSPRPASPQE